MKLKELLRDDGVPDLEVTGLAVDSRRVRRGDVFFAYRGSHEDGHAYAADAAGRGAAAIVSERPVDVALPNCVVPGLSRRVGIFADRFYDHPSASLDVVGVTGTNGKTSVAYTLASIVPASGFIGTIGWGLPDALCPAELTTADPVTLQSRLRELASGGARRAMLEVSSHALDQGRTSGVAFDVAVFTNLTRDHLDYHQSLTAYAGAKKRLFREPLRASVVNTDDAVGREIVREARGEVISIGTHGDVSWRDVAFAPQGLRGTWDTPWGSEPFELPGFFGMHGLYNGACVLAAAVMLGQEIGAIVRAMHDFGGVPGRMQTFTDGERTVIVDFAHTPAGIAAVLDAVRAHADGRITVVFGCGGDRDQGKRALMAAEAEQRADAVVITSDNPRSEDPEAILDDIERGFTRHNRYDARIADRREAIRHAIDRAEAGDIVVLAGKGHEKYQDFGDHREPFDEVAVALEMLGGAH